MRRKTNYAQIDLWYPALLCYLSKSTCFPKIMESDLPLWWFAFISKAHIVINIKLISLAEFFLSLTRSYLYWQGSHEQPFLRLFLLQWAFPSSHHLGFSVPFVQRFEYPCTKQVQPDELAQGFQSMNIPKNGIFTDALGSLFKCLTTLRIKICILITRISHVPACVNCLSYYWNPWQKFCHVTVELLS